MAKPIVTLNLKPLANFLVKAKRAGYASEGKRIVPSRLNSKDYGFQEAPFRYRDSYFGSLYDIGQEIVWLGETPVWGMNYMGGVGQESREDSIELFRFLQECLAQVAPETPFRGPSRVEKENLIYINEVTGDIARFIGTEKILRNSYDVYSRQYHGGLIFSRKYNLVHVK